MQETNTIGYYEGLVAKMLVCGDPEQMGYVAYCCLQCGQGTHRVAMSCQSSLCLRCATVSVDNWVSQVSKVLHEGMIYRHIILTVPAMFRTTFYQNAAVLLSAFRRGNSRRARREEQSTAPPLVGIFGDSSKGEG